MSHFLITCKKYYLFVFGYKLLSQEIFHKSDVEWFLKNPVLVDLQNQKVPKAKK